MAFAVATRLFSMQPKDALGSDESGLTSQILENGAIDGADFNSLENYVIAADIPPTTKTFNFSEFPTGGEIVALPIDFDGDGNPTIYGGQCVNWVTYTAGVVSYGNAKEWAASITTQIPSVGTIVVMRINDTLWHVGIVSKVEGDRILVRSRNYRGLWIVSDDWFEINNPIIMGYQEI